MSLAYLFWHRPAAGIDPGAYEERLLAFHRALALAGSATIRLDRTPWEDGHGGPVYEDWYPVEGWDGLGALAERAVSGARRAPHDAAAAVAADGAGGVYARVRAGTGPATARWAAWLAKPAGLAYAPFLDALATAAPRAAVWQRQLVLGPAPEFAVHADGPLDLPWPARATSPRPLSA